MNQRDVKSSFKKFTKIAEQLSNDKSKVLKRVQVGLKKAAENEGSLGNVWEKMQLLFSLAKDYSNGSYNNVSRSAIVAIIGSLLYFISPIDVIPDFIFGLGFIDDAFILGYVFKKVAKEIEKYQAWKLLRIE